MKRIWLFILTAAAALLFCVCGHEHIWAEADCTAPKTCVVCGKTEGEPAEHRWNGPGCTAPKTCAVCGATEGEPAGHSWTEATFKAPKTCTVCGITEGEPKVDFFERNGLKIEEELSCFSVTAVAADRMDDPSKIEPLEAEYTFLSCMVTPDSVYAGSRMNTLTYRLRFYIPPFTKYMMYDTGTLCDRYTGTVLAERPAGDEGYVSSTDTVHVDDTDYTVHHACRVTPLVKRQYSAETGQYTVEYEIIRRIRVPEDYDGLVLRFTGQKEWKPSEENGDPDPGRADPADGTGFNFRLGN